MEKLSVQAMEAIQWKISYEYTRDYVEDTYFGTHPLTLQVALTNNEEVGNLTVYWELRNYQQ